MSHVFEKFCEVCATDAREEPAVVQVTAADDARGVLISISLCASCVATVGDVIAELVTPEKSK